MNNLAPRTPNRPLIWPDILLELADWLLDQDDTTPVHIVGGAVRDAYLGYPLKDIDLVVGGGAIRMARRMADAFGGDVYVLDADREVARVLLDSPDGKLNIDVAGYRAPDLLGDLTDRDFTVNAMAVDLRGDTSRLIDPLGGEDDLNSKVIRRCAPYAISNDPVRALRAIRQSIKLGARIEPATLRDIRAAAPELSEVSAERVRDEFFKVLGSTKPWAGLRVMQALGLLAPVLPVAAALPADRWAQVLTASERAAHMFITISPARTDNTAATFGLGALVVGIDKFRRKLQTHLGHQWPNERAHTALLHLALLLRATIDHNDQLSPRKLAESVSNELRLSNPERTRLEKLLSAPENPATVYTQPLDVLTQHRYWHVMGEAGIDALLLALAEYLSVQGVALSQAAWVAVIERARVLFDAYYERHDTVVAPKPLVDGNQLVRALKIKPGALVGELLEMLREQQVLGQIFSADDAIAAARGYVNRLN
ncbi:MAG: hypothetical protein MUF38_11870 [Anaerolineae bacterium]|jgi:tRNA nucleotidyltransferase/poly(A) polymerase|nr:hypothetical protein [Anaerolineae bacterium]